MSSFRILRRGAIAVLLTVLLAAVAAFAWLQTAPGKRQLAGLIERAVSDDAASLEIGRIEGFLPFELRVGELKVADRAGVWLRIDNAALDWSPLALLSGRLDIDLVSADRVTVDRLPEGAEKAESGGTFSMPLAVRIARFEATEIVLEDPVLGAAATLSIEGAADLADPIIGFRLSADVRRIDAIPGTLGVELGYDPEIGRLSADISGTEPAGGVIARLLDLPGLPPVSLSLSGDGPLEAWRADLAIDAGAELAADAALEIAAEDGGYRLTIDAGGTLAGFVQGIGEPLLAGRSALRGTALIGRDGAVAFDRVTVTTAAGEVVLDGRADWPRGMLDATVAVAAGGPDVFAELLPGIGWDRARADIRILGPIDGPRIEVAAVADNLTADGLAVDRLAADIILDPVRYAGSDPSEKIPFEGQGTLEGLSVGDADLDALLAPAVAWRASGAVGLDGSSTFDRLDIEAAGAAVAASGAVGADGTLEGSGTLAIADLAVLQPLAGLPVEGGADLAWQARTADGGLAVEAEGSLNRARSGIAAVDTLLADAVEFRSAARIAAGGAIDVTEFRIDSGENAISGQIGLTGGRLSSDWSIAVASIAGYSDLAGRAIDGRITADGQVNGPLDRLSLQTDVSAGDLVIDGRAIPDLTARLSLDDLAGRPTGTVRLEGSPMDRAAVLEFGLDLRNENVVRFDPIAGSFSGLTVSGALDLLSDGQLSGRLVGRAEQLAPLAELLDVPLSGQADLVVGLSTAAGRQALRATLEMADAGFDDQVAAATVSAEMTVDDLFGARQLDGRATASGVRAAGGVFDRVAVRARGRADALTVSLEVAGDQLEGAASGDLALSDQGTQVNVKSLNAVVRGQAFTLAGPATVTIAPAAVTVQRLVISGGGGRAIVQGTLTDTLDASVEVREVPLELVSLFAPGLALGGHINGAARVSGPVGRPEGSFELRSSDLTSGFAGDAGLPKVEVTAAGRFSEGRLALDIKASMAEGAGITVRAALPLAPGGDAGSDLTARVTGNFDLLLFDDLLAAAGNRVEGLVTLDLRVSGTVGQPVVAGSANLSNGRYENAFYGSRLEEISATVAASGTALRLTQLSAKTPGGGTLTGSGSLTLDPERGYPVLLDVGLRNGAVVDTSLASATTDADLRLSGALVEKLRLSGEVSILGAEFRVPDRLPVSVPDLPVQEINVPPEFAAGRPTPPASEPAAAVDAELDLVASARQAVFVRGRGLNVELNGDLTIKGSAAAPAIDGNLGLRQGTVDILGRRLTFQRGGLDFDGSSRLDPEIDLLAATDVDDVAVAVEVGGRVSAPTITLTSVPELPQDDIAARLLFGKDVRSLTAFEALTLAQSLGQLTGLTGGSVNILDEVRQSIGLDRLEVDVGGETGEASVAGGRYVGEGVYVGVQQGLEEQSSRVNVEIELTPNIKVESEVGADAVGRVGVHVEWDY